MKSINRIELLGNVVSDATLRINDKGNKSLFFTLATNEQFKQVDGTVTTIPTYHNCVLFGDIGEKVNSSITKGIPLLIVGKMTYTQTKVSEEIYSMKCSVVVSDFHYLSAKV